MAPRLTPSADFVGSSPLGEQWLSNSSPQGEVDRGASPGPEGVNGVSTPPQR